MNVITIKINGIEYNLKGEEKEEYLRAIGNYVDKKIKNILENNDKLSTADASILAALNVADDMFKTGIMNDELEDAIEEVKTKEKEHLSKIKELEDNILKLKQQNKGISDDFNAKLKEANEKNEEFLSQINNMQTSKNQDGKQVEELVEQLQVMQEEIDKYKSLADKYKKDCKDLNFTMRSLRYKVIDLENKYLENQIELAKAKKQVVEVLNTDKKNKRR